MVGTFKTGLNRNIYKLIHDINNGEIIMSKKKNVEIETESKDARFRRLANVRAKKVIYELGRLTNMTSQPNYEILDTDAQKLLDSVTSAYSQFTDVYGKIANGQSIKQNKKELANIF